MAGSPIVPSDWVNHDDSRMGATMDNVDVDYTSFRSEKSRISVLFNKKLVVALMVSMLALLALGVGILVLGSSIGWALVGLSAIPAMAVEWYEGELHHLVVSNKPRSIDDILSGEVLGRLSKHPTPREVAVVICSLYGGHFFMARFGIGSKFLQQLSSEDAGDLGSVWQTAIQIREQTKSKNISAAVLLAALVKNAPNYQTLLSHLQLDIDDIIHGIDWYNHLNDMIDNHRAPKRTGEKIVPIPRFT